MSMEKVSESVQEEAKKVLLRTVSTNHIFNCFPYSLFFYFDWSIGRGGCTRSCSGIANSRCPASWRTKDQRGHYLARIHRQFDDIRAWEEWTWRLFVNLSCISICQFLNVHFVFARAIDGMHRITTVQELYEGGVLGSPNVPCMFYKDMPEEILVAFAAGKNSDFPCFSIFCVCMLSMFRCMLSMFCYVFGCIWMF